MTSIQDKNLDSIANTFDKALQVVQLKMADYSHEEDPWSNFRVAATVAGCTVNQAFLVLMGVKVARLENLLNSGATPANESVEDTLQDLVLYAAIHKSYLELKDSYDDSYSFSPPHELEEELLEPDRPRDIAAEVEPSPADKLKKFFGITT